MPSRFISAQNSKLTSEVWCSSELWGSATELQGTLVCRRYEGKGAAFLDWSQTSQEDRKHLRQLSLNDRKLAVFLERGRDIDTRVSNCKSFQFTKVNMYLLPGEQIKSL